jgi:hypothetical protein
MCGRYRRTTQNKSLRGGILRGIRKRLVVEHERSGSDARRNDKGLYIKSTDESAVSHAIAVCLDIALVPS